MNNTNLTESLKRYVGQTVTIFTTSGGASGDGFTGVLATVTDCTVKIITDIGEAPSCPLGSNCCGRNSIGRNGNNQRGSCCNSRVGSVTEIPLCKIAGFTHNAI